MLKKAVEATQCEYVVVMGTDGSDNSDDLSEFMIRLEVGKDLVIADSAMMIGLCLYVLWETVFFRFC